MDCDGQPTSIVEPNTNLGGAEPQGVLRFGGSARDSGHSCLFLAHNNPHVFQVVDRIVVMRRGRIVADDIDPKHISIEQVELVITGMAEHEVTGAAAPAG